MVAEARLGAEWVGHVEESVVESGEARRELERRVELEAGARLECPLEAAREIGLEPGAGKEEARRLRSDAVGLNEPKSAAEREARGEPRVDADRSRAVGAIEIDAEARGELEPRTELNHRVAAHSGREIGAGREERVEAALGAGVARSKEIARDRVEDHVRPEPDDDVARERFDDLGAGREHLVEHRPRIPESSPIEPERHGLPERSTTGDRVVISEVEPMEGGVEEGLEFTVLLRRPVVIGAEREGADLILGVEPVARAGLIVPIGEVDVRRDQLQEEGRISIATSGEDGAPSVGERRLDDGAGVDEADVPFGVELGSRRPRLTRDDRAGEPPILRGISSFVEVDAIDERRMNDAGAEPEVKEDRDANVVEEVADVAGRRAAHVEVREPRDDRRHAGHHFDGAKWISERAGEQAHLGARHRLRRWRELAADVDLERVGRLRRRRRLGRSRAVRRRRRVGLRRRWSDLFVKSDRDANAC